MEALSGLRPLLLGKGRQPRSEWASTRPFFLLVSLSCLMAGIEAPQRPGPSPCPQSGLRSNSTSGLAPRPWDRVVSVEGLSSSSCRENRACHPLAVREPQVEGSTQEWVAHGCTPVGMGLASSPHIAHQHLVQSPLGAPGQGNEAGG